MENSVKTKELLQIYYSGFAQKSGWESVIADDFKFTGGDMTNASPSVGKQKYIEIINKFSRVFKTMRVNEMIVEDDRACVIGNYDFVFPNGNHINGNVVELWKVKQDKLDSLTIYFDTLTFQKNTVK
jgi:ketosteroid isomerase-like protein